MDDLNSFDGQARYDLACGNLVLIASRSHHRAMEPGPRGHSLKHFWKLFYVIENSFLPDPLQYLLLASALILGVPWIL